MLETCKMIKAVIIGENTSGFITFARVKFTKVVLHLKRETDN